MGMKLIDQNYNASNPMWHNRFNFWMLVISIKDNAINSNKERSWRITLAFFTIVEIYQVNLCVSPKE